MKRTIKALTAHEVAALAKTIGEDVVGGAPGLVLRRRGNALGEVTSARWYLRKQGSGKARIALGKYPGMSLHDARVAALSSLKSISDGINPAKEAKAKAKAEKKAAEVAHLQALTVGDVLDEWLAYKVEHGTWGKGIHEKAEAVAHGRKAHKAKCRLTAGRAGGLV